MAKSKTTMQAFLHACCCALSFWLLTSTGWAEPAKGESAPAEVEAKKKADKTDHWAFKFGPRPPVPTVTNSAWCRNELDRFIAAKLEMEGLRPSLEADRRTLIRRLTFDVIGLPPTPDEVRAFIADSARDAYEKLVERLLALPRYGERWARHWLDVVHFGESHGYDKDKPRLNAWPYRDYVIRAFNNDKPYSRFVIEQIAGDVLFPNDPEGVVATGFIAAGPWDYVGHVELPISKTDGLIARYNDRDDMVMNTMSTFMSLTVHCARCHDHKFDPIRQVDYYRLQAVFSGVDRAERSWDSDPKMFVRRKRLLAKKNELARKRGEFEFAIQKISSPEIKSLDERLASLHKELRAQPQKESPSNGYHSNIESKAEVEKWVQLDLGRMTGIDRIRLIPARPTDFRDTPGFGFPARFRIDSSDRADFATKVALIEPTTQDFPNPGDHAFELPFKEIQARFVRVTATKLWERSKDYIFALAEMQVYSASNNLARGAVVSALDSIESGRWSKKALVDGFDSREMIEASGAVLDTRTKRKMLEQEIASLESERGQQVASLVSADIKSEQEVINRDFAAVTNELASLPKAQTVFAAANDFEPMGSFLPAKTPREVFRLRRGDVKTPGELVSPGTVGFLPGMSGEFALSDPADEGSRRATLAHWLTGPKNLLLRRSIVNRVWQYHFGRGIVDSPNDFGHMGALPSHPELLDWLAYWFEDHGESIKQLHRLILESATYRQASTEQEEFTKKDSDNRWLWRMNRARLDAESYHDALLQISGKLDLKMGGPSIQQFYFKDDHSPVYDYTRFDPESAGANRRSIYRFLVRSVPDPFMECLDCADPSLLTPKRMTTLTALQALSALNNPFVLKQVENFAARIRADADQPNSEIKSAYEIALNREPTLKEMELMRDYLKKFGLVNLCRVLVNSNEFMFLD